MHTAPGHGLDDYITGINNGLEVYCPLDDDGCYVADGQVPTELVGLSVLEADKKPSDANLGVLRITAANGSLIAKKKFVHNVLCDPDLMRQHIKVKVQFDDKRPEVMQKLNRSNEEPIIACYNIPKKYLTYKLKGKEAKEYLKENIRTKNIPLNSKLIPVTKSDLPENSLAYEGLYALFLNALDIDKLRKKTGHKRMDTDRWTTAAL